MAAVARRAQFPALLQTCNGYTDRTAITYQKSRQTYAVPGSFGGEGHAYRALRPSRRGVRECQSD